jgi:hypothetical protein
LNGAGSTILETVATVAVRDAIGILVDAGATWWDERQVQGSHLYRETPVLRRIDQGPPAAA